MSAPVALPTAEQLMGALALALKAHDVEAAVALLRVLAVVDPASAEVIYETVEALDGLQESASSASS